MTPTLVNETDIIDFTISLASGLEKPVIHGRGAPFAGQAGGRVRDRSRVQVYRRSPPEIMQRR